MRNFEPYLNLQYIRNHIINKIMQKNIITYLYVISLAFLFLNCSKRKEMILNSPSPNYYYLYIRFEDSSNNDMVKGIGYINDDGNTHHVNDAYQLNVSMPDNSLKDLHVGTTLFVKMTDFYNYLFIYTTTSPECRPDQLTHTFYCPHVFGDNIVHTIVSNWKAENPTHNVCSSLIVDGVTYLSDETDMYGDPIFLFISGK